MKQIEKIWFITGCSSGLGVRNGKSRSPSRRPGRSWKTGLRNSAPGRISADSLILQYKLKDFLHTPIFLSLLMTGPPFDMNEKGHYNTVS